MKRLLMLALLLGPATPVMAGSNPQVTVDDGRYEDGDRDPPTWAGEAGRLTVLGIMLALGGLWVTDRIIVARKERRKARGE